MHLLVEFKYFAYLFLILSLSSCQKEFDETCEIADFVGVWEGIEGCDSTNTILIREGFGNTIFEIENRWMITENLIDNCKISFFTNSSMDQYTFEIIDNNIMEITRLDLVDMSSCITTYQKT